MSLLAHVIESSLFAAMAALLALVLRASPARVRYAVWFCASVKFLIPLSALMAAGAALARWIPPLPSTPSITVAVRWLDAPFGTVDAVASAAVAPVPTAFPAVLALWLAGSFAVGCWRWREWGRLAATISAAREDAEGRASAALARVQQRHRHRGHVDLLLSEHLPVPCIAGVFRPRLLWPARLTARLSNPAIDAILAHELSHMRRRDTLGGFVHICVETVFWFNPIVWWIGARLVDERERACDEEVLEMGIDRRSYAAAIIDVCRYAGPFRAGVAMGAGDSSLARRIARIAGDGPPVMRTWMRLLLGGTVAVAVGMPVSAGMLEGQQDQRPAETSPAASRQDRDTAEVHRPGGDVTWPKLVHEVHPLYTAEAIRAKVQGSVVVEAVVLETGEVGDVRVVQSLDVDYGLDEACVDAVKQWQFEPGTKEGVAVAVLIDVELSFNLR